MATSTSSWANYLTANQLFINNGDGTFTEGAKAAGLDAIDASHTLAPCDYDGDGDLDLYLLTNRWYRPEGFPKEQTIAIIDGRPKILPKVGEILRCGADRGQRLFDTGSGSSGPPLSQ